MLRGSSECFDWCSQLALAHIDCLKVDKDILLDNGEVTFLPSCVIEHLALFSQRWLRIVSQTSERTGTRQDMRKRIDC